ncbi:MAG: response regulator [Candidatus Omnitrophica bacterium]|jgi:CheY-like chemotaxis protein|nr:response regulator [Candidatus Omnitrophota bacterium]
MDNLGRRILVVDDEPDVLTSLTHFLSDKGHCVSSACNAQEALGILEKEKEDVVLLDITMPGKSGAEVARFVKQRSPETKVIVVSGYPQEIDALSKEHVMDASFIKPVDIQKLYSKLMDSFNAKESPIYELDVQDEANARVLTVSAKLLFVEPSPEIYGFLNAYFHNLSSKGEEYTMDVVNSADTLMQKFEEFTPDIALVNAACLADYSKMMTLFAHNNFWPKAVVMYDIPSLDKINKIQLKKIIRTVQAACIKNGLIEIKWVQI